MCQTFYLQHQQCACIHILQDVNFCDAYLVAHVPFVPEGDGPPTNPFADPVNPFDDPGPKVGFKGKAPRPKLLTRAFKGLDFTHHDMDYMSIDVDNSMAPNALSCSNGITPKLTQRTERDDAACPLCDRPDVLELIRQMRRGDVDGKEGETGKGKGKEKEKGNLKTTAVKLLKNTFRGGTKK